MSSDSVTITPEILEHKIQSTVPGCTYVKAVDQSDGCGAKFEIIVVSGEFVGKAIIAQHRMVHKAIEEERKNIHALTLKTKTPDSWAQENSGEPDDA